MTESNNPLNNLSFASRLVSDATTPEAAVQQAVGVVESTQLPVQLVYDEEIVIPVWVGEDFLTAYERILRKLP